MINKIYNLKQSFSEAELHLSKENVVAVGIGYKKINGVKTDELCYVYSVKKKVDKNTLNSLQVLPEKIQKFSVDVIETGEIKALIDRTAKYRPSPNGVSIGHFRITAGTQGLIVKSSNITPPPPPSSSCSCAKLIAKTFNYVTKTIKCRTRLQVTLVKQLQGESLYILSNNHVLADSNNGVVGDAIYQPGPYDGGTSNDTIARLSTFIPIKFDASNNTVDCALALPTNQTDVSTSIVDIGIPTTITEGVLGLSIKKSGRTTELTTGTVEQINVTVTVSYGNNKIAIFTDQLMAGNMSAGGDSGSSVLSSDNKVIGLLFAGSDTTTIINRIQNVFQALQIELA